MNQAVWLARRNYWIAGIGAIVSAFAFLFISPFLSVEVSVSLFGFTKSGTKLLGAMDIASNQGLAWVSLLLVVVVLGVSIAFLVLPNPFGSRVPIQTQARWTGLGFVVAAVLSIVCLAVSLLLIKQNEQSLIPAGSPGSIFSNVIQVHITWGVGTYLFLAGLITMIVAGIMEAVSPVKTLTDGETGNTPQNQHPQSDYPPTIYGSTSMGQGTQPFNNTTTQYGGQPTVPYQPPAPPYRQ
jgi:hypothetical protein